MHRISSETRRWQRPVCRLKPGAVTQTIIHFTCDITGGRRGGTSQNLMQSEFPVSHDSQSLSSAQPLYKFPPTQKGITGWDRLDFNPGGYSESTLAEGQ